MGEDSVDMEGAECGQQNSAPFTPPDAEELRLSRLAADCAQKAMVGTFRLFMLKLQEVLDKDTQLSNSKLSDLVLQQLESSLDCEELEYLFVSLQSGKKFDINPFVESSDDLVPMEGSYLLSIGARYSDYPACIARTMLVNPTQTQQLAYRLTVEVHRQVVAACRPGVACCELYELATGHVKENHLRLLPLFVKRVGFAMGSEFIDSSVVLSQGCRRRLVAGMTLCVSVGFISNIGTAPAWAVWIADTVLVPAEAEVPTAVCSADPKRVMYKHGYKDKKGAATSAEAQPAAPVLPMASLAAKCKPRKRLRRNTSVLDVPPKPGHRKRRETGEKAELKPQIQKLRDTNHTWKRIGIELGVDKEVARRIWQTDAAVLDDPSHAHLKTLRSV